MPSPEYMPPNVEKLEENVKIGITVTDPHGEDGDDNPPRIRRGTGGEGVKALKRTRSRKQSGKANVTTHLAEYRTQSENPSVVMKRRFSNNSLQPLQRGASSIMSADTNSVVSSNSGLALDMGSGSTKGGLISKAKLFIKSKASSFKNKDGKLLGDDASYGGGSASFDKGNSRQSTILQESTSGLPNPNLMSQSRSRTNTGAQSITTLSLGRNKSVDRKSGNVSLDRDKNFSLMFHDQLSKQSLPDFMKPDKQIYVQMVVCGSSRFNESIKNVLRSTGYESKQIFVLE
jgi:hypothetical protein